MQGIMIEKHDKSFSQFNSIIKALKDEHKKYNWLITEIDFVPTDGNGLFLNQPYTWILGEDLERKFSKEKGFWVWGVFSGFPKNITLDEVLKFSLPYADGNPNLWNANLALQNPLAKVELIEWDGMCFLGVTDDAAILRNLKEAFPLGSQDLEEYNLEEE